MTKRKQTKPYVPLFLYRYVSPSCPSCGAADAFGLITAPQIPGESMFRILPCLACETLFSIETYSPEFGRSAAKLRDISDPIF